MNQRMLFIYVIFDISENKINLIMPRIFVYRCLDVLQLILIKLFVIQKFMELLFIITYLAISTSLIV